MCYNAPMDAVRLKGWGFWLIVGGMLALFAATPTIKGLGLLAGVLGFGMFIAGRMKQ